MQVFIKNSYLLTIVFATFAGNEIFCAQTDNVENLFENYDQLENPDNIFTKMIAIRSKIQAKKEAKIQKESTKLEAESRSAKFEADMSEIRVELEVAPVTTEELLEMDIETAENLFRQCLIINRHSFELSQSGIPKVCEDFGRVLRLLGGNSETNELIKAFQQ